MVIGSWNSLMAYSRQTSGINATTISKENSTYIRIIRIYRISSLVLVLSFLIMSTSLHIQFRLFHTSCSHTIRKNSGWDLVTKI